MKEIKHNWSKKVKFLPYDVSLTILVLFYFILIFYVLFYNFSFNNLLNILGSYKSGHKTCYIPIFYIK